MASGSRDGAAPLPANINLTKAKIVKKKHDWSWEDEMLMYDVSHRDSAKKRRLGNKVTFSSLAKIHRALLTQFSHLAEKCHSKTTKIAGVGFTKVKPKYKKIWFIIRGFGYLRNYKVKSAEFCIAR